MQVNVPTEIIAAFIGLVGAGLGYAYREYRNRARPFMQVTRIDGTITKSADRVEIVENVSNKLKSTFYLDELDQESSLGDVFEVHRKIRRVKEWWPEDTPAIDQVLAATTDDEMSGALASAFSFRSVEAWLLTLLVTDRITVPAVTQGSSEKIPVHEDNDSNGQVWFLFPNKARSFANNLNRPAIRAKVQPLIESIRHLDQAAIKSVFKQFKTKVEKEYQTAMECADEVKSKTDANSRWCLRCYLANLSSNPIVIENTASLTVVDKTRVKYRENCYLALIKTDDDGEQSLSDTATPLVVRGGEDVQFALITERTQTNMPLGTALREAFDRKESKCHAGITIRRVGLLKRQRFRSQSTSFVETKLD